MSLITLLLFLIILGVVTWAITTYIPMVPAIKNLIIIVVVIVAAIYVLNAFGILNRLNMTVPSIGNK